MIVISPLAKRGFIDCTQYDTPFILRFVEKSWNLPALSTADAIRVFGNLINTFSTNPIVNR